MLSKGMDSFVETLSVAPHRALLTVFVNRIAGQCEYITGIVTSLEPPKV